MKSNFTVKQVYTLFICKISVFFWQYVHGTANGIILN